MGPTTLNSESRTQAETVYAALRSDILSCRLAPGVKIRINEVATRLGVSLGAVREALSRLSAERMTVPVAQKGHVVAPVSVDDLRDLTQTRITIEQLCLRDAIEHGDVEWETQLVGSFHRLHRIPEKDPIDSTLLNEAWAAAHFVFHEALVAGGRSTWLKTLRKLLYDQSERYRRLSVPLRKGDRDVDAEHKSIMEAALARNPNRACLLIEEHLSITTQILLTSPILTSGVAVERTGTAGK